MPPTSRLGTSGLGGLATNKSGQNRKRGAFSKSRQTIKISTFFSIFLVRIFSDPKFGRVVGAPPPSGRPWQGGSCTPNSKISFLHRFRELRGRTYHFHHQNHGLDGFRARYFGPTGPGCGDMAKLRTRMVNYNYNQPKMPTMGHFGQLWV